MAYPLHIDEVPEYRVSGDCMRVTWRELEVFIPIPICLAAMGRCKSAIDEWERRNATVMRFPEAAE